MPRDLFGDVTRPSISIGNRKWYTVPVSLLSHAVIVVLAVVIPLMATDVLPSPWDSIDAVVIPIMPIVPPPPPITRHAEALPPSNPNLAPTEAPSGIEPEKPAPDPSFQNEMPVGTIVGVGDPTGALVAPPAPPPVRQEPVRVGGAIRQPQKTRDVRPAYPPIAQAARVEGIVIIEATIGADGQVVDTRVLRSIPLLDQAALEAVQQWHYTPTTLNGVPVPVIMTVTVQFVLSR